MKHIIVITIISVLFASILTGCKQNNKNATKLQALAEKINAQPDKELPSGTILTKCEYKAGDSVFTYHIKVEDNRFNKVETDSIKASLVRKIASPEMKNLRTALLKANVGLRYVYDSDSKEISIVFSHKELLNIINKE